MIYKKLLMKELKFAKILKFLNMVILNIIQLHNKLKNSKKI